MAEIHHFDHGLLTPTVSYVLSVLGSLLGLPRLRRPVQVGAERRVAGLVA